MKPIRPFSKKSRSPPTAQVTTGKPYAMASRPRLAAPPYAKGKNRHRRNGMRRTSPNPRRDPGRKRQPASGNLRSALRLPVPTRRRPPSARRTDTPSSEARRHSAHRRFPSTSRLSPETDVESSPLHAGADAYRLTLRFDQQLIVHRRGVNEYGFLVARHAQPVLEFAA